MIFNTLLTWKLPQLANYILCDFAKVQVQFRIRIQNFEIRIRIQQQVLDPDPQHFD
jgi:hypothetical protein